MLYGLQTHFDAPIGFDLCRQLANLGVELCRGGDYADDGNTVRAIVSEVEAVGMAALIIVNSIDGLHELPTSAIVEWGNEPDGDIDPKVYRRILDRACAVAIERGLKLWAPAISNLDDDSLRWLNRVRDAGSGWPAGLAGISAHSYGPFPHRGFASRDSEVEWLKAACAGLPFGISEFGLATADGVTEDQQAAFYRDEWAFWERHGASFAIAYQLNDGPAGGNEESFGIRRLDGSWKPSAYTFPRAAADTETKDIAMSLETYPESWLVPGETPGTHAIKKPNGKIVSMQPNGTIEERDHIQSWESGRRSGNELVYVHEHRAFALPIAVGV